MLLDGVDSLDGGTITTALNYSLYDGPFRKDYAGALDLFRQPLAAWPAQRNTDGGGSSRRWSSWSRICRRIPTASCSTTFGVPKVLHADVSEYAKRGVQESLTNIEKVLEPLPVERIDFKGMRDTESHIQGSLRMGTDRARR